MRADFSPLSARLAGHRTSPHRPASGSATAGRAAAAAARVTAAACRRMPEQRMPRPDGLSRLNRALVGLGAGPVVEAPMCGGHTMRVDLRSGSEWYAFYSGRYDAGHIAAMQRLMRREGTVAVDAGANVGFWTVPLARRAAELRGRVIAVEPVPANARRLQENIRRNRLGAHAEVLTVALSDGTGQCLVTLREDFENGAPTGNAAVLIDDGGDERFESLTVDTVSLDVLLEQRGNPDVDVIKADIEGHEDRFLAGAARTLARSRPAVFLEWNPVYFARRGIDAGAAIGAALDGLGYVCIRRTRDGWTAHDEVFSPRSVDDLVLAPAERAREVTAAFEAAGGAGDRW